MHGDSFFFLLFFLFFFILSTNRLIPKRKEEDQNHGKYIEPHMLPISPGMLVVETTNTNAVRRLRSPIGTVVSDQNGVFFYFYFLVFLFYIFNQTILTDNIIYELWLSSFFFF